MIVGADRDTSLAGAQHALDEGRCLLLTDGVEVQTARGPCSG
jgi:hypothetical protein